MPATSIYWVQFGCKKDSTSAITAISLFYKSLIVNTMDNQRWIPHGEINACHVVMVV